MTRKLIAETRLRYNGNIYEKGNTFICLKSDADEILKEKQAKPYPKASPEVIAEKIEEGKIAPEAILPKKKIRRRGVTIITAIKDNLYYLKMCIDAVYKNTKNEFEYIIVDNGSGKEVKNYLIDLQRQHRNIRVITNKTNMLYAYACNQGIKVAKYDYLCMLDADTYVTPGWLKKLMRTFSLYPDCGIAVPGQAANKGAVYVNFKLKAIKNIDYEVAKFAAGLPEVYKEKQIFHVYGFCHLVKREVYKKIGVYDWKRYYALASNETDLFWRAGLKGFKIYWAKGVYVHHFHNKIKISLGFNPSLMCDKGHEIFQKRQKNPKDFYVKNDVKIEANMDLAYKYNDKYNELKPYFNE